MSAKPNSQDQALSTLLQAYDVPPGSYDELRTPDGRMRTHWRTFVDALTALPPRERLARASRLDRQVRETGLVHDIFADPDTENAQWQLNLTPLIISAGEWRWLEQALCQRARLFKAILADIYGPQNLLSSGSIPPALVFSDPAYLRNCHGIEPPGGHLQFYAMDLARGPDGQWRVIDSHAETPAGIGYAVANRIMQADVADDIFATCDARRLASHFHGLHAALVARNGAKSPNIVLLTPGPSHDDYFSHAYMARYLGMQLVEGGDLRVVGDELFLKTLEGLKPVDSVVRCIEGSKSDPLELDPDVFDGPVGLLNACRKSPSLMTNALGSAVIENRGLGGYLPILCQHLLGEDLMLWDAPRWWLGDDTARDHVVSQLDNMIIRPAREGTGRPGRATLGRSTQAMSDAERELLKQDMEMHGHRLVAEQPIGFSTMPTLTAQGLKPQPIALRLFVSAMQDGFGVLPGGVAMAVDPHAAVALSASSGDTHDVWVLRDAPEKPFVSLWQSQLETARIDRAQRALQSRVADNLFWLGRYVERADWTLRVARGGLGHRRLEYFGPSPAGPSAEICLQLLLQKGQKPADKPMPAPPVREGIKAQQLARELMSDRRGIYSLEQSFNGIYRVANLTRDRLSLEAWRAIAKFQVGDNWHNRILEAGASELLDEIEDKLAIISTFSGHMHESMTRNYGWFFLNIGRRLERAYNLVDTLNALFAESASAETDSERLKFVLELADSFITYRSRYRVEPMLPLVLDLLVMDESNPRSLAYQMAVLTRHLEGLPQATEGTALPRERRIVLGLQTSVRLADVEALSTTDDNGTRPALAVFLQQALADLPALSDAISRRYFRLTDDEPHRVAPRTEQRQP